MADVPRIYINRHLGGLGASSVSLMVVMIYSHKIE
jgi:hypothetical protein